MHSFQLRKLACDHKTDEFSENEGSGHSEKHCLHVVHAVLPLMDMVLVVVEEQQLQQVAEAEKHAHDRNKNTNSVQTIHPVIREVLLL
jgi:hypothetical protein